MLMFECDGSWYLVTIVNEKPVVAKATVDSGTTLAKIKSAGLLAFNLNLFFASVSSGVIEIISKPY